MVDKMLQQQIIEPAHGPWSSPIVLVKKKMAPPGPAKFSCKNFRMINSRVKKFRRNDPLLH